MMQPPTLLACAENRERLKVKHAAAGNVVQIIQQSKDARDYCLDSRDISNLRRHIEFEEFMHDINNSASLLHKVCTLVTKPAHPVHTSSPDQHILWMLVLPP